MTRSPGDSGHDDSGTLQAGPGATATSDRALGTPESLDELAFDDRGLVPVVTQDVANGAVLMVAWANREALRLSLQTGQMHFWSRSREELWRKGESSGNTLTVCSLHADCDGDTVLALVDPAGPACHTGDATCFGAGARPTGGPDPSPDPLDQLRDVLDRRAVARPEGSYTTRLLEDENLRLKKLGEETAELVTALARGDDARAVEEAADLLYHLLAALRAREITLDDVRDVLGRRRTGGAPPSPPD